MTDGAASDAILDRIVKDAKGDARIAIQTLRHSAVRAEESGSEVIGLEHLCGGHIEAEETKRRYLLAKLSEHHRLLYAIIDERREIRSNDLWKEYRARTLKSGMQSVATRTFNLHLKQLRDAGLILYRRALGVRGNIRIYRVKNE